MGRPVGFTQPLRERALVLRSEGLEVPEIGRRVGLQARTIHEWLKRGAEPDAPADRAEFFARWQALDEREQPLSQVDLERLLEAKARKGTTIAILALLTRPWERPEPPKEVTTPVAKLMAELTRRRELPSGEPEVVDAEVVASNGHAA